MARCFIFISSGDYAHVILDNINTDEDDSGKEKKIIVHDPNNKYSQLYAQHCLVYGIAKSEELKTTIDKLIEERGEDTTIPLPIGADAESDRLILQNGGE